MAAPRANAKFNFSDELIASAQGASTPAPWDVADSKEVTVPSVVEGKNDTGASKQKAVTKAKRPAPAYRKDGEALKLLNVKMPQATHTKFLLHCALIKESMNGRINYLIEQDLKAHSKEIQSLLQEMNESF